MSLHALLEQDRLQLAAGLLDPHGRPTRLTLQLSLSYRGPGQQHSRLIIIYQSTFWQHGKNR